MLSTHSCSKEAVYLKHFSKDPQLCLHAKRVRLPTRDSVASINVGSILVDGALFDPSKEGVNLALQALQHQRPITGSWLNEVLE